MTFTTNHSFGDIVYLKTDKEQLPRTVVGIRHRSIHTPIYYLAQGVNESEHYEIEFSTEKDILFSVT